jgi:hypothetical protein
MTLGGSPPAPAAAAAETENKLELSFEYLVAADKLVWVRVVSSQAILMSLCLQSMVEELVRIRAGEKEPRRLTRCAAKPRTQVVLASALHGHVFWRIFAQISEVFLT